jgi:predicted permease
LVTKSLLNLRSYDFTFNTENVFTARVGLFDTDYPDRVARTRFFNDLLLRVEAVPGAQAVALSEAIPPGGAGGARFAIEGETYESDQDYPFTRTNGISPGFFETFEIELSRGRGFTAQDDADALPVAIVSQRFADRFFEGQDPIGRRIREGTAESEASWRTIVGVAPNDIEVEWSGGNDLDPTLMYIPVQQRDARFLTIDIRTSGDPLQLTSAVRRAVRTIDSDLPIYNVYTAQGVWERETWFFSVFGSLFIVFGAVALFMASVGLYGVLSFSVSRRVQEMGIRMALGARAQDVVRLVLRQGVAQLAIGLGVGLLMAFGLSSVLGILMFDVEPRDPLVFGLIVAVISVVGILASFVPARRATGVHPMEALRYE